LPKGQVKKRLAAKLEILL